MRGRERGRADRSRAREGRTARNWELSRNQRGNRQERGNGHSRRRSEKRQEAWGYDKRVYNQATVFFFTNFPDEWSYGSMWETFCKHGRVLDIYSPPRKSKLGKRFGFVRFLDVKNEGVLERQLDQIRVGMTKLWVNRPRFRETKERSREDRKPVENAHVKPWRSYAEVVKGKYRMEEEPMKQTKSATVGGVDQHKQRDRDTQKWPTQAWKMRNKERANVGLEFRVKEEELTWLEGCYVITTYSMELIPTLQEKFFMEGYFSCKVRPIGGRLVLLEGGDKEEMKDLVELALEWLGQWFEDIKPWNPKLVARERQSSKCVDGKVEDDDKDRRSNVESKNEKVADVESDSRSAEESIKQSDNECIVADIGNTLGLLINSQEETTEEHAWGGGAKWATNIGPGATKKKEVSKVKGAGAEREKTEDKSDNEEEVQRGDGSFVGVETHGEEQSFWQGFESETGQVKAWMGRTERKSKKQRRKRMRSCSKQRSQSRIAALKIEIDACELRLKVARESRSRGLQRELVLPKEITRMRSCEGLKLWRSGTGRVVGKEGKKRGVRELVAREKVDFLSVQESKVEVVDAQLCRALWGSDSFEWVAQPSKGMAGGLICIWNPELLKKDRIIEGDNFIGIFEFWGVANTPVYIINIYFLCDLAGKRALWATLKILILENGGNWCLMGDFNAVRNEQEWRGGSIRRDMPEFDKFISDCGLVDLPLIGRKFTWYQTNGATMSRLERFLLSEEWCLNWEDVKQWGLNCSYSDHCPIVLKNQIINWGPKPFRELLEEVKEIKEGVAKHFESLFQEEEWNHPVLDGIEFKKISAEEGSMLEAPFKEEEVKQAVWSCESSKAPGPDGFNFKFIKEMWEVIKGDILGFVDDFQKHGKLVKWVNSSFIVLIPKVDNPQKIEEFRPISLVGVMYKIIAKLLAHRLSSVLNGVIGENQMAFIGGRQLADSVVIANETTDEAQKRKQAGFVIKLDFKKAYDKVCWAFLDYMMLRLGFGQKWRGWMTECLKTAEVLVLLNGSTTRQFGMQRGLRQGDPLSPFLFLIVAEGLNGIIKSVISHGLFEGITVGQSGLKVTHLQFADDTIVFGKASEENIWAVKCIMRIFEIVSGLKINFGKSLLMGINVSNDWMKKMSIIMNCKQGVLPCKYLGMPIGGRYRSIAMWKPIIDAFKKKLASWKTRFDSLT
ncbi:hypothetical protein SLEP1_g18404 [Rubroshorea leprosula]|uniref:Reverse transcriptase domain-containing protein n=1 Tax=Rubroshorea leprosula TaxID=152421 RepID=A0AAV5J374_9ROSI|nr:hypothetical protein SLEP1_g18404 [Rubroshorea leprosula]